MLVKLNNDWFAPNATLLRVSDNPHELEDDLLPFLPPSALLDNGKGEFVPMDQLDLPGHPTGGPINPVGGKDGEKNAVPDKTDTPVTKK